MRWVHRALGTFAIAGFLFVFGYWSWSVAQDDKARTEVRTQLLDIDGVTCTVVTRDKAMQVVCPPRR